MSKNPCHIALIGATGSVGSSVLDICRAFPEKFKIIFLVAHRNALKMNDLIHEFHPIGAALTDREAASILRTLQSEVSVYETDDDLEYIVTHPEIDHVVFASSGTAAIKALQKALLADKIVSLANKESIVVAAPWVMPLVRRTDQLRPLDSEHNAIWQCLQGEDKETVEEIYLTASGGPFRTYDQKALRHVTPEMALAHPVWDMGYKVSIDSATLMNKGIEIIEAMYLFDLEHTQVKAVICPGSIVHGIVRFTDGTLKMAASTPDMRLAAATALSYPGRLRLSALPQIMPLSVHSLTVQFYPPDEKLFPCLALAKEAARKKGPYPSLLVGADEVAVDAFLRREISFTQISLVIEQVLSSYNDNAPQTLEESLIILERGRERARALIRSAGRCGKERKSYDR